VHRLFFPPLAKILAAFWDGLASAEIPSHVGVSL
jgi:ABC-type nitrate/sulfonate/bicarbonate transport system permease component